MTEIRTKIINEVDFGPDPIAKNMGLKAMRARIKFNGGDFVVTHMADPYLDPPPENYTKRHCADYLTQMFRDEIERALDLRP